MTNGNIPLHASAKPEACHPDFRPTASIAKLRRRAELLAAARQFFHDRGYWEVETPILSRDACVDAHIDPFHTEYATGDGRRRDTLYLQTSPEFAMKRLLAAGSGSIYQIAKTFRNGETGPLHNPEFTMIEWYRVGGDYHELMAEVDQLVQALAHTQAADRIAYRDAFGRYAGIDPLVDDDQVLHKLARSHGWLDSASERDDVLNFLLAALVEPNLGLERPAFLFDFPASQAALAQVKHSDPPVAERFELYVGGMELCNGYQELTDPNELRRRNARSNEIRAAQGKPLLPVDSLLLVAMEAGLPECAGVALGFDRLAMLSLHCPQLSDVVAFPYLNA